MWVSWLLVIPHCQVSPPSQSFRVPQLYVVSVLVWPAQPLSDTHALHPGDSQSWPSKMAKLGFQQLPKAHRKWVGAHGCQEQGWSGRLLGGREASEGFFFDLG